MMQLILDVYRGWKAEVVFITSDFEGTKEMLEGCKEANIPAFVRHSNFSIWDVVFDGRLAGNVVGFLMYFYHIPRISRQVCNRIMKFKPYHYHLFVCLFLFFGGRG
jgi:hypothetical protein